MEVQRPYQRFLHERFWERSTKSRDVPPIRDWLELFRKDGAYSLDERTAVKLIRSPSRITTIITSSPG